MFPLRDLIIADYVFFRVKGLLPVILKVLLLAGASCQHLILAALRHL